MIGRILDNINRRINICSFDAVCVNGGLVGSVFLAKMLVGHRKAVQVRFHPICMQEYTLLLKMPEAESLLSTDSGGKKKNRVCSCKEDKVNTS